MASILRCCWLEWVSCSPTTASSPMWTTCIASLRVQINLHLSISKKTQASLRWLLSSAGGFRNIYRVRHESDLHIGGSAGRHPQQRVGGETQHAHQDHCRYVRAVEPKDPHGKSEVCLHPGNGFCTGVSKVCQNICRTSRSFFVLLEFWTCSENLQRISQGNAMIPQFYRLLKKIVISRNAFIHTETPKKTHKKKQS